MAPKRSQTNGDRTGNASNEHSGPGNLETKDSNRKKARSAAGNKKRKAHDETTSGASSKAPRRSVRSTPGDLSSQEQVRLLNFLLSPTCVPLTRPADERKDVEARGGDDKVKTYSVSNFTPLEELIGAMILSRPIGRPKIFIADTLGQRSIRTLFNPPHNLNTLAAIRKAGYDGVRAALDEARTQHRQKTAEQLVALADFVADGEGMDESDTSLEAVRETSEHDAQAERNMLQKQIKGLAKTGLDIFGRRIQRLWPEWYPFVDNRTMESIVKLGLPKDAEALKQLVEEQWDDLEVPKDLSGQGEERKRHSFVRILERTIGAELEGNLDEVKKEALK